jgi:pyruvate dehydrogenase E1 component alpha subunit
MTLLEQTLPPAALDRGAGLDARELVGLFRDMTALRAFDELAVDYHHQGRIGTYAIYWGHEAMQAGALRALGEQDWVFPSYRESAVGILRGMPIATVLSWWRGEPAGWWDPHAQRVASVCVPVATHVPHAVGFAWGERLKGDDTCALVFFGDGATSEGAFHEGATFAGVVEAPVVLFCNNNGWAISTPVSAQTAARTLADKAAGYGIPAVRVDGGDVLAVHDVTRTAIERARDGGGPTFIEAVTYRMAPHATADDPSLYLNPERVEAERSRECLARYEAQLAGAGLLTPDDADSIRRDARARVRDAMAVVEARDEAPPTDIFDSVYAAPPPSLLADRDAVAREFEAAR